MIIASRETRERSRGSGILFFIVDNASTSMATTLIFLLPRTPPSPPPSICILTITITTIFFSYVLFSLPLPQSFSPSFRPPTPSSQHFGLHHRILNTAATLSTTQVGMCRFTYPSSSQKKQLRWQQHPQPKSQTAAASSQKKMRGRVKL